MGGGDARTQDQLERLVGVLLMAKGYKRSCDLFWIML